MNIDNCKFLFYLTGKCFLSKETNAKYLYVKHFKNMLCYQGWDKNTPYLNASKRKTFSLPVGQYVSAFNFYNSRNSTNPHTPTLVLKINGNTTIVTIEDVMIKANKDSEQELVLKINDNYETHATKRNLSIDGSSMKLEDIENSSDLETMNVVCELMISAMSYKYLNHDKYLSNLQVPFSKKEYDDRYNVYGGLFSYSGKGHINLNFLLEDDCEISKDGEDYILTIKKNLCGFQVWHDKSVALNKSNTRFVFNVLPSQMQSIIHQHGSMIENFGLSMNEMGFQPTCIFSIDNGSKLYIGVIKDMEIDHSFQGFENGGNVTNNKIRLSTVQISGNLGGKKNNVVLRNNELPEGSHSISMNIDASELGWGATPTTNISDTSSSGWFSGSQTTSSTSSTQEQQDQIASLVNEMRANTDNSDISNDPDYLSADEWATLLQLAYTVSVETGVSLYKEYLDDMIKCLYTQKEGELCKTSTNDETTDDTNNLTLDGVSQDTDDDESTSDIVSKDFKTYGLGLANFVALDAGFKLFNNILRKTLTSSGRAEVGSFLKSIGPSLNKSWKTFFNSSGVGKLLGRSGVTYEYVDSSFLEAGEEVGAFSEEVMKLLDPDGRFKKSVGEAKEIANTERTAFRERANYPGDNASPKKLEEWKNADALDENGELVLEESETSGGYRRPLTNEEYEKMQYEKTVTSNLDTNAVENVKLNTNRLGAELEGNPGLAEAMGPTGDTIIKYKNTLEEAGEGVISVLDSSVAEGVEELLVDVGLVTEEGGGEIAMEIFEGALKAA